MIETIFTPEKHANKGKMKEKQKKERKLKGKLGGGGKGKLAVQREEALL